MKTVLFFARDPGGANTIIPVYKRMNGKYNKLVYAKGFAIKMMEKENIQVVDIEQSSGQSESEIIDFVRQLHPDIIVTGTSLNDYTERYLWKAAEILKIKSFAILDQWMNLGIRFSEYDYGKMDEYNKHKKHQYLPTYILAMDENAKNTMVQEGISENRIIVTGQPHFDVVNQKYLCAKAAYDKKFWNVVFVSEPISQDYDDDSEQMYWGYNEKTIFNNLYKCIKELSDKYDIKSRIIIRPHPREDRENWRKILLDSYNSKVIIECNSESDSFDIMKSADVVCGMSSMFLLEAFICKKHTLSIEIGLERENPFILDRMGICKSVISEKELLQKLENILKVQNSNNIKEKCEFNYITNATQNVISFVEEEMAK